MSKYLARALVFVSLALLAGCKSNPRSGDPCRTSYDNICEGPNGPGIWWCDTTAGQYRYSRCPQACVDSGFVSWTGECGNGSSGWQVCLCN